MTSYRSLARNRDFTALWIGQTISELGSHVSLFVFPLLAYALTGSALLAAAVEALFLLGLAATLLPAGVLADRVDRRRLMRISCGAGFVLYGSLVAAGLADRITVVHLLTVALLTGAATGLFEPAEIAAVRAVVRPDELTTALSQNQARQHVARLLGGPLGGLLYGVTRWLPFAADALSYAVAWVLLGRIRTDLSAPERTGPPRRPREDLAIGFRYVATHPFIRVLMTWGALSNLAVNALFFVAVLRLIQGGFDPVHIGLVSTAAGMAGILGAIAAPFVIDRVATGHLTVAVAWSSVPLSIPMILWNHPAAVAFALSAGLFLSPAGNAGIGSYRIAITPAELQGRVQSSMQFSAVSIMPLAPVLGGVGLTLLGGPGAVAALAALLAGVALIPTVSRTVRSVPKPAVWQQELREAEVSTAR
ncbi:MAG: MFS transporter [Nocardioides sp.]